MRIGCLHTANSNIDVFEAALGSLDRADIKLGHMVRPDLLAAAAQAGEMNEVIAMQTRKALAVLCAQNDAVLLTCSTLGPAIKAMTSTVPVLRVDEALARQAVADGKKVIALCAAKTTLAPTLDLFKRIAKDTGVAVEVRLVDDAWDYFMAGDLNRYFFTMAEAADRAYVDGTDVVAFAQASMAGATVYVKQSRNPLTSPVCGLYAAIAACQRKLD